MSILAAQVSFCRRKRRSHPSPSANIYRRRRLFRHGYLSSLLTFPVIVNVCTFQKREILIVCEHRAEGKGQDDDNDDDDYEVM